MTRITLNPDLGQAPWRGDGRPSLLIADDDPVVRSALGYQLQGNFRVVGMAKDATEAIELASEHHPDAALLDVEMPGGGARAAVAEIAVLAPATALVILSADESRAVVLELLTAGAIAYVRKGLTSAEIAETVASALKAKVHSPRL